ncbi:hypothetical protein MNBD_GAMMA12-2907 [hydrothermal vent metagenome]|uniref:Uncharacterized protein n=1 Tax=hydrothermal vent metagenome TaxID=652676 RepID=A0A3B0Z1G8_9ZZZZ
MLLNTRIQSDAVFKFMSRGNRQWSLLARVISMADEHGSSGAGLLSDCTTTGITVLDLSLSFQL